MTMNILQRIIMLAATFFIAIHAMNPPCKREGGHYFRRFLFQRYDEYGYSSTVETGQFLAEFTVLAAAASFLYLAAGLLPNKLTEPRKWSDLLDADQLPSRTP